jgi:hypothetical protein
LIRGDARRLDAVFSLEFLDKHEGFQVPLAIDQSVVTAPDLQGETLQLPHPAKSNSI